MKLKEGKYTLSTARLVLALLILVNPTLKTVDLLPDIIGGLLLIPILTYYADRAPHFSEALGAMKRLCALSVIKVFAFIAMIFIRSGNVADNDIVVLFTFVFAIFEAFILTVFIRELFSGLYYAGLRTDADAPIKPFSVIGNLKISPDVLKVTSISFVILRAALTSLPETLLLTTTDEIGVATQLFNIRALYPRFTVAAFIITILFGILVTFLFCRYIKAIRKEGKLSGEADALHQGEQRLALDNKAIMRKINAALTLVAAASLFSLCVRVNTFSNIDILPDFIAPILVFIAAYILKDLTKSKMLYVASAIYAITAIASESVLVSFIQEHGYPSLIGGVTPKYMNVIFYSSLECAAAIFTYISLLIFMLRFAGEHAVYRGAIIKSTRARIYCTCIFGAVYAVMKMVLTFVNSEMTSEMVSQSGSVTMSHIPWLSTVVCAVALVYIALSFSLRSYLIEECKMKYESDT